MKKYFIILSLLVLSISALWAQKGKDYNISFEQSRPDVYTLTFTVDNWGFENINPDGTTYTRINFSSGALTQEEGFAELPFISASVQLPSQRDMDMTILSSEYEEVVLEHPLMPSRGIIYRNQDPAAIPYRIAAESMVDNFYPTEQAYMEKPFIVRDVRGTSVRVFPFSWNAITKTLRIYTKLEVELKTNNNIPTNPLLRENLSPVKEAVGMYRNMFINYSPAKVALGMAEYGDLLVITTERDEEVIEPYISWKREKGINVSKEVVGRGSNVKTLIQQKYKENNKLMYVLLVGDWGDIRSDYENLESGVSGPTDPMLGCVIGDDVFPDIAIGRFSAENVEQVTTQVNKTIGYEKNPDVSSNWMEAFIGIGSNEVALGDDGEKDYEHIQRIYSERLEPFTYNIHRENYAPLANKNTLIEHINKGASTMAYCGHGVTTYFVTTGISNDDVKLLNNEGRLPFIVAVACHTGAFHSSISDCFGETWLRKANGGAVVAWMSSIEQPWNPPQRGQDYFYDILSGGFDYSEYETQNGINTSEQRTHWGSLAVNAMGLMLLESSGNADIMTVKTWITFGDPSLQLRTKMPTEIVASNEKIVTGANFETIITSNGAPVENAMVCISKDGVYAKAMTNAEGKVNIEHELTPGDALLVVTAFNAATIYKEVLCISPEGPYIMIDDVKVNDENKQLDYSDGAVKLNMILKNIGNGSAKDVKVTISTEDPYITFITNSAVFPSVTANADTTLEDAFEIKIDKNVPDQHRILFKAVIEESDTWEREFYLTAHSFNFVVSDLSVNDVKDRTLKPNETVNIKFTLTNKGHADASSVISSAFTESPYINLPTPSSFDMGNLSIGESCKVEIIATVSEHIPSEYDANIILSFTTGNGALREVPVTLSTPYYCTPSLQDCSDGDKFTSFILGDIVNTDETCSTNGYSDYTHLSTVLEAGVEHTAKAMFGYTNERAQGWIDYNGNGVFDSNEALFILRGGKAGLEVSQAFTIPEDAVPGTHRMRVRVKYQTVPTNPCTDNAEKGQTHDYTVIIPERFPRVKNLSAMWQTNKINLTWEAPEAGDKKLIGYRINRNGVLLKDNFNGLSLEDTAVIDGNVYVYEVVSVYENGTSIPAISNIIVMGATGICQDIRPESTFTVFPNPVVDVLHITGNSIPSNISIFDMSSRLVYSSDKCNMDTTIPTTSLKQGVYLLIIDTEEGRIVKKFIKRTSN